MTMDYLGNTEILNLPKTAFLASSTIPTDMVLKCYDWATQMAKEQGAKIIAITDKYIRDQVAEKNRAIGGWPEGFDPFYGAPIILVVLADGHAEES